MAEFPFRDPAWWDQIPTSTSFKVHYRDYNREKRTRTLFFDEVKHFVEYEGDLEYMIIFQDIKENIGNKQLAHPIYLENILGLLEINGEAWREAKKKFKNTVPTPGIDLFTLQNKPESPQSIPKPHNDGRKIPQNRLKHIVFTDGFQCSTFIEALEHYGIVHNKSDSAHREIDSYIRKNPDLGYKVGS